MPGIRVLLIAAAQGGRTFPSAQIPFLATPGRAQDSESLEWLRDDPSLDGEIVCVEICADKAGINAVFAARLARKTHFVLGACGP